MGAFLLSPAGNAPARGVLDEAFRLRGFAAPEEFPLGRAVLHLSPKTGLALPNVIRRPVGGGREAVLATLGSPVYKGLGWRQGQEALLEDLLEDRLDPDRMAGASCLVFYDPRKGDRPRLHGDPSGLYHLFQDERSGRIGSSQLIQLQSAVHPFALDHAALLDLLLAGYLVAPRTLFRGLRLVTSAAPPLPADWFDWQGLLAPITPPEIPGGFGEHLEHQIQVLRAHLQLCKGLFAEQGVDMGLSGGYDSRLLVLLARELEMPFSTHTHVKEKDDRDRMIARRISAALGLPLREEATRPPSAMDAAEQEEVLQASFGFYDGHVVEMMDLMKREYTEGYRRAVLDGKGVNLSGVGGEIYRNYNYTRPAGRMAVRDWVGYYVINYRNLACLQDPAVREAAVSRLARSILGAMERPVDEPVDFLQARRYYGEIWLSNWHGTRNSVESSCCVYQAPFADRRVVREALGSTSRIGVHGAFEAGMIARLNPELAALPSNYGFPFTRIPAKHRLGAALRAWLPNSLKLALGRRRMASLAPDRGHADALCRRHPVLARSLQRIESLGLPLDWDRLLAAPGSRIFAFSLGYMLERLEGCVTTSTAGPEDLLREEAR